MSAIAHAPLTSGQALSPATDPPSLNRGAKLLRRRNSLLRQLRRVQDDLDAIPDSGRPRLKPADYFGPLGPVKTAETFRDAGRDREIIVSIYGRQVIYQLAGRPEHYILPHTVGVQRAMGLAAGVDTGPRQGRLARGEANL